MRFKSNIKAFLVVLGIHTCAYLVITANYIITEFFTNTNPNVNVASNSNRVNCDKRPKEPIPNILHQIYAFKDPLLLEDHRMKREQWIKMHSNYTHMLWSAADVMRLIKAEYPQLYWLYASYGHWIQRSDVARYIILYHYGGWYVDLDVVCKKTVHSLSADAFKNNQRVVLHKTFPAGPSNDFIGCTPWHPFFRSLLDALPKSNRWFVFPHANIMLTTGPTFLWGRLMNYPCQEEVVVLDHSTFNQYIYIKHDGSWHSWDEMIISLFVQYTKLCVLFIAIALGLTVTIVLRSKRSDHRFFKEVVSFISKRMKV